MITFMHFSPNNSKWQFKKTIFEIKIPYVTNDTVETSIKSHIYHYTAPCKTIICDSDGGAGNHVSRQ
jgi:hypothetical protein